MKLTKLLILVKFLLIPVTVFSQPKQPGSKPTEIGAEAAPRFNVPNASPTQAVPKLAPTPTPTPPPFIKGLQPPNTASGDIIPPPPPLRPPAPPPPPAPPAPPAPPREHK